MHLILVYLTSRYNPLGECTSKGTIRPLTTPPVAQIPETPSQSPTALQFLDQAKLNALLSMSGSPLTINGLGNGLPTMTGVSSVFSPSSRNTPDMLHSTIFPQSNEHVLKQLMNYQFSSEIPQIPALGLQGLGEFFSPFQNPHAASQFFQVLVLHFKQASS